MPINPKSLANLQPGQSNPLYDELKKQRSVTLTETGWIEVKKIAKEKFGVSVSELLEQVGRGKLELTPKS